MVSELYLGKTRIVNRPLASSGEFVSKDGSSYYCISNYHKLPTFFTSMVSSSNHWFYIASSGALSCGRIDPDRALFPYYTVDKIEENAANTGAMSIFRVQSGDRTYLWEPFCRSTVDVYDVTRKFYKSASGDKVIFEEINHELGLIFSYSWTCSDLFGFVRESQMQNISEQELLIDVLDGIQNILPAGANRSAQNELSCLLDAYKKNELDLPTKLALFTMSSILVDKAEPAESLKATSVWSDGAGDSMILISSQQVDAFRYGESLRPEELVNGMRGSYFVNKRITSKPGSFNRWKIVADIEQSASALVRLQNQLEVDRLGLGDELELDLKRGREKLCRLIHAADGAQITEDRMMDVHHFANVLFNVMRGGVFAQNMDIQSADFASYVKRCNVTVYRRHEKNWPTLPLQMTYQNLSETLLNWQDAALLRLAIAYLPLTFSRRHGDPSRPWNNFVINVKNSDGSERYDYQGNWRDLFQNWEALGRSFPMFTKGMIARFVNASTADGYNPYRIMKDNMEWEEPNPHDPWANIGYWGDHQLIYLLRFLEWAEAHNPQLLPMMFNEELYSYAEVPYTIKPYHELLKDSKNTVDFDEEKDKKLKQRAAIHGSDGKSCWTGDEVYQVNLLEKILVSLLTKISNFVPEGGIWLNTQRPEWNDANNALVGHGLSMVTVCYLRRYLQFMLELFSDPERSLAMAFPISIEVVKFFRECMNVFAEKQPLLAASWTSQQRRHFVDQLGQIGSEYRSLIYTHGFSGHKVSLSQQDIVTFFRMARDHMDQSIRSNRREDGLYHSYNLMTLEADGGVGIRQLYEMLEGQVAVLSSGLLQAEEALSVIRALRMSRMYRADQHSYMLYPERTLPRFLEKNRIESEKVESIRLVQQMLERQDKRLFEVDARGFYHFHDSLQNATCLQELLAQLAQESQYGPWVEAARAKLLDLYEDTFDHKAFTGRSGTFYGYEGIGCIYWHMVAKLLLAVQEVLAQAVEQDASPGTLEGLRSAYFDIRSGLGFSKSPSVWGAFPFDPYSHTPKHALARQPGMTGQVKEEVLTRFEELGIQVEQGLLRFHPYLLRPEEFLRTPQAFTLYDEHGTKRELHVPADALGFTYCQVPIVYQLGDRAQIRVIFHSGASEVIIGLILTSELSQAVLRRTGVIKQIEVMITADLLCPIALAKSE